MIFAVMLWRGISIEPQWVVLALLLVALLLGRGRSFIFDWAPFLVLFLAYEAMRGFAAKTGFAPHDVSGLEHLLFGPTLPTVRLQEALYHADRIGPLDWATMVFYFLHFPLPILVGFIFWLNSRELYWRYISALLLMSFLAFLTYLAWPSTPPWIEHPDRVVKVVDATIRKWGVDYYVSPVYTSLNPNRYAAFPSLHAAYPLLAALFAWGGHRRLSVAIFLWAAGVWFSIVYLGEHYVVDALMGAVYALAALAIVEVLAGRRRRHPVPDRPGAAPTQTPAP